MFVFGPETHMTAIVSMALGKKPIPREPESEPHTANFLLPGGIEKSPPTSGKVSRATSRTDQPEKADAAPPVREYH
jgi:ATP citrate (pro-S)-lyase